MKNYEKKYKEALEVAKRKLCFDKAGMVDSFTPNDIYEIFPELKESEDEKIRKVLIELVKCNEKSGYKLLNNVPTSSMVAWLEKQGEQKSADKVEPKFKVGDWIIDVQGVSANQIIGYEDDSYYIETSCSKFYLPMKLAEKNYRLWTIQDAKDGDVLAFNDGHGNDCIDLIKSVTDKKIEFWFCLTNGNRYEVFDGITPYTNLASREDATPATKEQREQLEKAMSDAGYAFDFDKKELKKIDTKLNDDSVSNELRAASIKHAKKEILNNTFPNNEEFELVYTFEEGAKWNAAQNPAWNEKYIADVFEKVGLAKIVREKSNDALTIALQDAMIELCKVTLQPKPTAWSEEDENIKEWIMSDINKLLALNRKSFVIADKEIIWLKSLKDRVGCEANCITTKEWKPSDEQIKALNYVVNLMAPRWSMIENDCYYNALKSLRDQLKKLK